MNKKRLIGTLVVLLVCCGLTTLIILMNRQTIEAQPPVMRDLPQCYEADGAFIQTDDCVQILQKYIST